MTNNELTKLFIQQFDSPKTQRIYAYGIRLFLDSVGGKSVIEATVEDVSNWRASLTGAASTQFTNWCGVRSFFRWLALAGYIQHDPAAAVRGPKRVRNRTPRIPSDDQMRAILDASTTGNYRRDTRDRAIVALCANGLRIEEVTSLLWENLIEDGNDLVLRIVGKGNKERLVPLSTFTTLALRRWCLDIGAPTSGPIFTDYVDGSLKMTTRQVQCAFDRIAKVAGVEGVSPHQLRHHYATRLIRAGADVFSVSRLLGHESVETTQVYVNLDFSDLKRAVALDTMGDNA